MFVIGNCYVIKFLPELFSISSLHQKYVILLILEKFPLSLSNTLIEVALLFLVVLPKL